MFSLILAEAAANVPGGNANVAIAVALISAVSAVVIAALGLGAAYVQKKNKGKGSGPEAGYDALTKDLREEIKRKDFEIEDLRLELKSTQKELTAETNARRFTERENDKLRRQNGDYQ